MKPRMYDLHRELELRHWWFAARRQIVLSQMHKHLPAGARPRLLDAGCGMGGFLPHLARLGEAAGMDPSPDAVAEARRQSGADVRVGSLPDDVPFAPESFDAITLLDVLEHIDDDVAAARRVASLLRPGGLLFLTVPAYPFLWSRHDELNEHKRRYRPDPLRRVLAAAGFRIRFLSYYNTLLFPAVAAVRLLGRLRASDAEPSVGAVREPINTMLRLTFAAERWPLRVAAMPFGVSLLAVAERADARPVAEATRA